MRKSSLQDELKKLAEELEKIQKKENDEINFFDAVNMAGQEIRHSAFFAWLFDSSKPHGLGNRVLKKLFAYLYAYDKNSDILGKLVVDGVEIEKTSGNSQDVFVGLVKGETEVQRERDHIDILIEIPATKTIVVIENKVDATTYNNQLVRYANVVDEAYPDYKKIFIYMTKRGEDPVNRGKGADQQINERYCKFSYEEFFSVLDEIKPKRKTAKDQKLNSILEDYIKMCKNNLFHENPDAFELCGAITDTYKTAMVAMDVYRNSATPEKVLAYCKKKLGISDTYTTNLFMTPAMEEVFTRSNETSNMYFFHIAFIIDPSKETVAKINNKSVKRVIRYSLRIELEKKEGTPWTPVQQKIIKALFDNGLLNPKYKNVGEINNSAGVAFPDGKLSLTLLTAKERMEPFDSPETQKLLGDRLAVALSVVKQVEGLIKNL